MTATVICALLLSVTLSLGDMFIRCPLEDIQVIADATALDGEYVQGVIYWPLVVGEGNPVAIALMNRAMDYEYVAGETLDETLASFSGSEHGIVGSMFTVNTLESDVLDITISVEFLGAYPSTFESWFTFDTRTGRRLTAGDIFLEDGIVDLVALLDTALQRNIETKLRENEAEFGEVTYVQEYDQHFTREDLDSFSVLPEGIVFRHDFDFAHVAEALEPEGEIFLEWHLLDGYIDMDGPLAELVSR